jgi:hypothetical protein
MPLGGFLVNHHLQSAELHELEGVSIKSRSFAVNDEICYSRGFQSERSPMK